MRAPKPDATLPAEDERGCETGLNQRNIRDRDRSAFIGGRNLDER